VWPNKLPRLSPTMPYPVSTCGLLVLLLHTWIPTAVGGQSPPDTVLIRERVIVYTDEDCTDRMSYEEVEHLVEDAMHGTANVTLLIVPVRSGIGVTPEVVDVREESSCNADNNARHLRDCVPVASQGAWIQSKQKTCTLLGSPPSRVPPPSVVLQYRLGLYRDDDCPVRLPYGDVKNLVAVHKSHGATNASVLVLANASHRVVGDADVVLTLRVPDCLATGDASKVGSCVAMDGDTSTGTTVWVHCMERTCRVPWPPTRGSATRVGGPGVFLLAAGALLVTIATSL
jgi:hypothetical protein